MALINLELDLDITSAESKVKTLMSKLKEYSKIELDAGGFSDSLNKVTKGKKAVIETEIDIAKLSNQIKNQLPTLARDNKTKLDVELQFKKTLFIAELTEQISQAKKLLRDPELSKSQKVVITADIQSLSSNLTEAKRQLQNYKNTGDETLSRLQAKFNGVGQSLKGFGSSILGGLGFTASIGAIGQSVGQFFSDSTAAARKFQSGLALINTVAKLQGKELQNLGADIKNVSEQYGIAKDVILQAGFNIASAGIEGKNLGAILELSARAAVASGEDITTNFNGIIAVVKGYGLQLSESTKIADLFFKANEVGQTTVGQMASSIQGVTPIANVAGLSLEELFAVYGTLTGVTGNASEVTTQLERTLASIVAPSVEGRNVMNSLGISFDQNTIKTKGLAGAMKELYDKTGGNPELIRKVVGSAEALKLVLALGSEQAQNFATNTNKMKDSVGALDLAVNEMTKTEDFQLKVAEEKRNSFSISVGNSITFMLSYILKFGEYISILPSILGGALGLMAGDLISFIGNIIAFGTNLSRNMKIAGNNLVISFLKPFSGLSSGMVNILNAGIKLVEGFINKNISKINGFSKSINAVFGTSIGKISDVSIGGISSTGIKQQIGELQAYNTTLQAINATNSQNSFTKRGADITSKTKTAVGKAFNSVGQSDRDTTEQIKNRIKDGIINKQTDNNDTTPPPSQKDKAGKGKQETPEEKARKEIDAKTKSLENQRTKEIEAISKSKADELQKAQDILKINEEYQTKIDNLKKPNKSAVEDAKKIVDDTLTKLKSYESEMSKTTDKLKTNINDISKNITDNLKKIEEINQKIKDINASTQTKLSERFIAVEEEIKRLNGQGNLSSDDSKKLQSLQQEKQLITDNTTEAERGEAIRVAGLSTSEKLLENRNKELGQLEKSKKELETQTITLITELKTQDALYQESLLYRAQLQDALKNSVISSYNQMSKSLDAYNAKLRQSISLKNQLDGNVGTVTTNDNKTINVTQVVNNQSDYQQAFKDLDRMVNG